MIFMEHFCPEWNASLSEMWQRYSVERADADLRPCFDGTDLFYYRKVSKFCQIQRKRSHHQYEMRTVIFAPVLLNLLAACEAKLGDTSEAEQAESCSKLLDAFMTSKKYLSKFMS